MASSFPTGESSSKTFPRDFYFNFSPKAFTLSQCVCVSSLSVCVCLVVVVFILFSTALSFAEFIVVGQVQRPKH